MTDTQTDLLDTLKGIKANIDSFLMGEWTSTQEGWEALSNKARAAIERAEAAKPEPPKCRACNDTGEADGNDPHGGTGTCLSCNTLDLHDQIEAKRVHECPKCNSDTDTNYNNSPLGNEYFEFCTNEHCEWEKVLGTVTETLS